MKPVSQQFLIWNRTYGIKNYTTIEENGSVFAYNASVDSSYLKNITRNELVWTGSSEKYPIKADVFLRIDSIWDYSHSFYYDWKAKIMGWISPWKSWADWNYKICFNVTNPNNYDAVNATFNRTLNVATLVAAGKMQSDYDDLRVVNASDVEYPYNWTVFNSSDLNIYWRKPNNFTASLTESVCFRYGNPTASSGVSLWRNVSLLFDDFNNGTTLDTLLWQNIGGGSKIKQTGGYLSVESNVAFYTNVIGTTRNFNYPVRIDFEFKKQTGTGVTILWWGATGTVLKNTTEFYVLSDFISTDIRNDATNQLENAFTTPGNSWTNGSLIVNSTNVVLVINNTNYYYHVGTFKSIAPSFLTGQQEFYLGGGAASNVSLDNLNIYYYFPILPTYSAYGSEQFTGDPTLLT